MMKRFFDVTDQITNETDFEMNEQRKRISVDMWDATTRDEIQEQRNRAKELIWKYYPNHSVFIAARGCSLPVLTVRQLEAEVLSEIEN